MQKTVAILTTFWEWNPAFSLTSVIHDQLVAHVKNGYRTQLFVLENFTDEKKVPEGVEVLKVLPQLILEPYQGTNFPDNWKEEAKKVEDILKEHAREADYIIAHDWIFIDTYLPYNIGLRDADLAAKKFHWIHSAPSPRIELEDNPHANRFVMPQNSKLVYLNDDKVIDLAEMYATFPKDVRVVPNSMDPRTLWDLDPFVNKMIDKYDLLSADIISTYPLSTPRMIGGKQIDVVIRLHGRLKQMGYNTKLIIPNAHCNAKREQDLVESMMDLVQKNGLTTTDVLFTSREGFDEGVTRRIVSDFFSTSPTKPLLPNIPKLYPTDCFCIITNLRDLLVVPNRRLSWPF